MTNEMREELINELLAKAKAIRQAKGIEYSVAEDINAVFNSNTDIGVSDVQSLGIFMDKHYRAIRSFIKNGNVLSEPIDERLADMINYLLIMYSVIKGKQ